MAPTIHHDIIYNASTGRSGSHQCQAGDAASVTLVQDAIVKHAGSYVEVIAVTFEMDAAGNSPAGSFKLDLSNLSYDVLPIQTDHIQGAHPFTLIHDEDPAQDQHVVTISAPGGSDIVKTVFNFGSDFGPPTKLVVKVERQPAGYTCPP